MLGYGGGGAETGGEGLGIEPSTAERLPLCCWRRLSACICCVNCAWACGPFCTTSGCWRHAFNGAGLLPRGPGIGGAFGMGDMRLSNCFGGRGGAGSVTGCGVVDAE